MFWVEPSHVSGKITKGVEGIVDGFPCIIFSGRSNGFIKPAQLHAVKAIVFHLYWRDKGRNKPEGLKVILESSSPPFSLTGQNSFLKEVGSIPLL